MNLRAIGIVSVFVLLCGGLLCLPAEAQPEEPYQLIAWKYGLIAWLNPSEPLGSGFVQRLEEAVRASFGFWEMSLPVPGDGWQHPEMNERRSSAETLPQLLKRDPATRIMWRVNPLMWRDRQIHPLTVIVAPDAATQIDRLGGVDYAAFYVGLPDALGIDPSLLSLFGSRRVVVCKQAEEFGTLVHEFTHWLILEWSLGESVDISTLPQLIEEGMAEASSRLFRGPLSEDRSYLRRWSAFNALTDQLHGYEVYIVGESFVTYLIEQYGKAGVLAQLGEWSEQPETWMTTHEAAWKRSQGITEPTWLYWIGTVTVVFLLLGGGTLWRRNGRRPSKPN
jgi:hypothetical protein